VSARRLLIGGALLAGLSIRLPWYEVQFFGIDVSVSGVEAREQASVALIIAGAAASGAFGVRREIPLLGAAAVAVIVAACFIWVPEVPRPREPDELVDGYTLSIELSRAWGLWVAAAGAAAMLAGAIRLARA
jgi:hypothetical protein